jgi:ribonuclease R
VSVFAPAPEGAIVAVLEKRGRFLVAEPLFPRPRGEGGPAGLRGQVGRLAVDPRSARGNGGRPAAAGDLVLVAPGRQRRPGARKSGAPAAGSVLRVLGRPEVARNVIEALMLDRGLRRAFDPAVEREARAARDHGLRAASGQGTVRRRDLRGLPTFTIDPLDAKDFDDAISAESLADGVIRVWVHIADVAAYVAEGSLIDLEARRRATSVYVPGAVEPMLPEALSNDACSLVPGRERLAVTVELALRGVVIERAAFYRSLIRSDARLSYEQVDRVFAGREAPQEPWSAPLMAAREAAAALGADRARRGGLSVDSPEPEFVFDCDGNVSEVSGRSQTESHRVIEHLMIAANEAVARQLADHATPCLYRVHERPQPERVRRLVEQLASLDVPTPPVPELLSPSQAAKLVSEISRRVDEHARRRGHGRIGLTSLVLRALKQAYYSPVNVGHAGLGSACYCHFTSPIRRYPDLVCHRALLSVVGAGEQAPQASALAELGAWTSERERAAMVIERDADDVARCFALERTLFESGWAAQFAGEVTGVISAGGFVAFGPEHPTESAVPPYEGMLPVRRLRTGPGGESERDWWELNEQGTILIGTRTEAALRLGDAVAVRVHRVEPVRGRVDLEPASARGRD